MSLRAAAAVVSGASATDEIIAEYRRRTPRSEKQHREASRFLPGGVNRNIVHFEPHPLFVRQAEGAYVIDEDGNRYLDCIGNYTAMAIGHAHPDVVAAAIEQVRRGSAWAAASTLEAELARMISRRIPAMERIRFTASGTEATLMALRAARAYTGRPLVAKFEGGYHGLHDYAMISMAPPLDLAGPADTPSAVAPPGIPDAVRDTVLVLPFNDIEATRRLVLAHAEELACILVEPVPGVAGVLVPEPGFLQALRALADQIGILLIFDEVISFRLAYGGAQELFATAPDLTTLGKIIGGGYPIGAVGGRAAVMDVFAPSGTGPKVGLSGTFHANPVGLAAGIATLQVFSNEAVRALNSLSIRFFERVRELAGGCEYPVQLNAIGSLFNLHLSAGPVRSFRDAQRADREGLRLLYLALLNEGVMLSPRGMGVLSCAMSPADLNHFSVALGQALKKLPVGDRALA